MGVEGLKFKDMAKDGTDVVHFIQSNYDWKCCHNCNECFPGLEISEKTIRNPGKNEDEQWCTRCVKLLEKDNRRTEEEAEHMELWKKFTADNKMHDDREVPEFMKDMTLAEGLLVSRNITMMAVYRLRLGQYGYSGNVISFPQDVQSVVDTLPRTPDDLKILIFRKHGSQGGHKDFFVRKERVKEALYFLKGNNPHYGDIIINDEMIDSLPEGDHIDKDIPSMNEEEGDSDSEDEDAGQSEGEDHGDGDHGGIPVEMSQTTGHVETEKEDGQISGDEDEILMETVLPSVAEVRTEKEQKEEDVDRLLADVEPTDWPDIASRPADEFNEQGLLTKAFPLLFPYGTCDLNEGREIPVDAKEYFRHLLFYKDQRFARDCRFRYVAMNMILRRRAMESGRVFVHKNPVEKALTVDELQKMNKHEKQELLKKIMRYGQSLPGTKQYWYGKRQELLQLIKDKGLPTIFFTVSAADLQWPDLHRLMPEYKSKAEAVNENPLLCTWFFMERVKLLLDQVMKRDLISNHSTVDTEDQEKQIIHMTDHWGRVEFQHRGSIHFHGLAWLKDAPEIESMDLKNNEDDKQNVINFFEKLLSCSVPCEDPDAVPQIPTNPASVPYFKIENHDLDYLGIVLYCHTHRCRVVFCRKDGITPCRFRFPFEKSTESKIVVTADEKTKKESAEIQLKRNHCYVNSHCRKIAETNRSNTDAQAIVDQYKVVSYVTKYVCKPEPKSEMMQKLLSSTTASRFNPVDPVRQLAQRLLIRCVGDRDYSAQETMHYLMGYEHLKKLERELENEDGEVTLRKGLVEKYMERPKEYNTHPLCKFYRECNVVSSRVVERRKEAIVVPVGLRRVTRQSPLFDKYCANYLIFHKPFRKVADLKDDNESYADAFSRFNEDYKEERCAVSEAVELADEERERGSGGEESGKGVEDWQLAEFACLLEKHPNLRDQLLTSEHDWSTEYQNNPQLYDEARQFATRIMTDAGPDNTLIPEADITHLNTEQFEVYGAVDEHQAQSQDAVPPPPLRYIVTGTAGTGKSYLIRCLRGLLKRRVLLIGPTGVCASNIQGQTVHSALRIPIREFKEMKGPALEQLQERWKDVEYVISEEMSMAGLRLFNKIDRRLRQIFPHSSRDTDREFFGSRSVIMFGDFGQLSPPLDTSLFRTSRNDEARAGRCAYKQFNRCTILKQIVRQEGEANKQFREMLQRIRTGEIRKEDYEVLKRRFSKCKNITADEEKQWSDAVWLFSKNEKVAEHNYKNLRRQGKPIALIEAEHTGGPAAKKATYDDCGLEQSMLLCEGAKIMLTANLNVQQGLCNGTLGTVKKIVYRDGGPPGLPTCVVCEFPDYTGPGFGDQPNLFPVIPITRRFHYGGIDCTRTAVPLRLAWAITIHKAQGLTLEKAVVDIGDREFSNGLTFVALSRARSLDGLLLLPFEFKRLQQLGEPEKSTKKGKTQKTLPVRPRMYYLRKEDERLRSMEQGLDCSLVTSESVESKQAGVKSDQDSQTDSAEDEVAVRHQAAPPTKAKKRILAPVEDVAPGWSNTEPKHQEVDFIPTPSDHPQRIRTAASLGVHYLVPMRYKPAGAQFRFKPLSQTVQPSIIIHLRNLCDELFGGHEDVNLSAQILRTDPYDAPKMIPNQRVPPKQVINVAGDGHCFYHAVSRAITGFNDNNHLVLRRLLARFIEVKQGTPNYQDLLVRENLVAEVGHDHSYAGEEEFQWMAEMLGVKIFVFYPGIDPNIPHEEAVSKPYQWLPFRPKQYLKFPPRADRPDGAIIDEEAGIYLYFCCADMGQYKWPNHFTVVTRI